MKSKSGKAILLLFVLVLLTSCKKWILFDISRFTFGFFLTLVIGVIFLIIMLIKDKDKNR